MDLHLTAEMRFRFLAEANASLTSSLDYQTALEQVIAIAVPGLADYCAIHVVDDQLQLKVVGFEHIDPEKRPVLEEMLRSYPPDPASAKTPASQALRTGKSVHVHTLPSLLEPGLTRD